MSPSPAAWTSPDAFSSPEETAPRLGSGDRDDLSTASSPDLATLVERFSEPPGDEPDPVTPAPPVPRTPVPPPIPAAAAPRPERRKQPRPPAPAPLPQAAPRLPAQASKPALKTPGLTIGGFRLDGFRLDGVPKGGLIAGLAGLALVPISFLFFLWWQSPAQYTGAEQELIVTDAPAAMAQPAEAESALEVVLTTPERIEASAGAVIAFPIAIDATGALPAHSVVAVSGLPRDGSFLQGRPYGEHGWNLHPDEIAGLQLRLPKEPGTVGMRLELIAGDGSKLAQSITELSITPSPIAVVDASAAESAVEAPAADAASGQASAQDSEVKVNTVKTVAIAPSGETRADTPPYEGAYALGPATPVEWMETKTAVDMHAKAQQSSETVKVAEGGLKLRVTARDKNWVQVNDPKSGTTGWIYNRFLKEAEAPAE